MLRARLELARSIDRGILSALCIPFHHQSVHPSVVKQPYSLNITCLLLFVKPYFVSAFGNDFFDLLQVGV